MSMFEVEQIQQKELISKLNLQIVELESVLGRFTKENEKLNLKLDEEKKKLEDLQFRMAEETIDKSTLECKSADDDSRIFELEEALATARDANEAAEAELAKLRDELIKAVQTTETGVATEPTTADDGPKESEDLAPELRGGDEEKQDLQSAGELETHLQEQIQELKAQVQVRT
ncbi:unnamed protein product [Protopolystoma xenopodis]|uniref:Uncharacterized protein n=1 Tax=Protopolystoma xenopodis TaxID=117903 RepID=A0A3S5A6S7_9PLAT|nr:unnamed protein product [Protopolystoma xenopodis]